MKKLIAQIIKFGIVGFLAFIIDYSVFYLLTDIIGVHYIISSVVSFIASVILNYILSIKWVFDVNKKQTIKDLIIFMILSTIGLLINVLILWVSVEQFNIHHMIGKLIAVFIVMIWNFVTRKIFIEGKA